MTNMTVGLGSESGYMDMYHFFKLEWDIFKKLWNAVHDVHVITSY